MPKTEWPEDCDEDFVDNWNWLLQWPESATNDELSHAIRYAHHMGDHHARGDHLTPTQRATMLKSLHTHMARLEAEQTARKGRRDSMLTRNEMEHINDEEWNEIEREMRDEMQTELQNESKKGDNPMVTTDQTTLGKIANLKREYADDETGTGVLSPGQFQQIIDTLREVIYNEVRKRREQAAAQRKPGEPQRYDQDINELQRGISQLSRANGDLVAGLDAIATERRMMENKRMEPIAREARHLVEAHREVGKPMTYSRALQIATNRAQVRAKLRYSRQQPTEQGLFNRVQAYQAARRREGIRLDMATAKRHVLLGLS